MRSGGCAVKQSLAGDAAAVIPQAVSAARRRGHAQVTPLHVASAMLSADSSAAGAGLLRAACLRSRSSTPLQCKALELCLNVALRRLATTGGAHHPAAAFGGFQHRAGSPPPVLSNALAAAFKRAQPSQRRCGSSSDGRQQQGAVNEIEIEQLVVSILDDPSVSRVMREAGFSSAEVKVHVEKAAVAASSDHLSNNTATGSASPPNNPNTNDPTTRAVKPDVAGDAARVLDAMASGSKRCVAVVGEGAEAVVKAVMDRASKGEDLLPQHEFFRRLQFVPLSLRRMQRDEVDATAGDLRALASRASAAGKGVAVVLEDLGPAAEAWADAAWRRRSGSGLYDDSCYYCPVEHAVAELSRLVRGDHDVRFWVLAFGSHAAYAVCRDGQPSLEAVLGMHPVVVPHGGLLALSLGGDSELTYCSTDTVAATPASAPSWLHHRFQGPVLSGAELTLSFSSPATASSIRGSGLPHRDANLSSTTRHDLLDHQQQLLWLSHRHGGPGVVVESRDQLWPASPNPASSISVSISSTVANNEPASHRHQWRPKFAELTAENLKLLCGALEARVPWHRGVAPGVASAVLRCRSGVTRAARPSSAATWLVFRGTDSGGKTAMARELARLVFGSYDDFITLTAAPASGSCSGEGGEFISHKRRRSPELSGYVQRLHHAVRENPHRVFLVDGVEIPDTDDSEEATGVIKSAIATGTVRGCNGDVVSLEDAIVVLNCEASFESWSKARPSPRRLKRRDVSDGIGSKEDDDDGTEKRAMQPRLSLDLNACAVDGDLLEAGGSSLDGVGIPADAVDGVFFFQY